MVYYTSLEYEHSPLPSLKSEKAEKLAEQFYEEWRWRDHARQELVDEIWPACDDAFSCRRDLPKNKGMKWADKSDFGDTDIRDGVLFLANAITLALMPPDDSWLELYSLQSNDQWRKNRMRDYQEWLHRKADTRGNYETHVTQALVRGCSAITWEWKTVKRLKRLGYTEAQIRALAKYEAEGIYTDPNELRRSEREEYIAYNGPVIKTLDMYDVFPDPCARIGAGADVPVAVLTYKTIEELKSARDYNGEPLYGNLDGITPTSVTNIYKNQNKRYRSLQTLGVNPIGFTGGEREYIPVLVFHRQLQTLDNSSDQWVDTYFEVALTDDFAGARLIRAYENPSDMGLPCVFFDTYSDFIANTPYQTGVVEKALSSWQSKNVISALALQAQLTTVFPAVAIMTDVLVNPKKVDMSCGGINLVKRTNAGLNFAAPLLLSGNGPNEGMTYQQFYGQKILGSMGAYGAIMQSPDRTITRSKTATQINTETTSGSIGRDNLLQKFVIRSLEPLAKAVLYASIQYNPQGIESFERTVDGRIIGDALAPEDMQLEWNLTVTGQKAKVNKAQEMMELQQMFQYATTPNPIMAQSNPMLVPLANKLLMTILGRLGMKDLEQYEQDPMQLLMNHPAIKQQFQEALQQAFQQGAQQGGMPGAMLQGLPGGAQGAPPPAAPGQPPSGQPPLPFSQQEVNVA